MNDVIYLEVNRSNNAILSYFKELPGTQSSKVDYVPATVAELAYLNGLEAGVLPPGMVSTLDDLQAHRERVQAAQKAKSANPIKATPAAPQQPAKAAHDTKKADSSQKVANFKNGFKPVQNTKKVQ